MKNIVKVVSFLVLIMFMSSCSGDKNSLTKNYALEHLKKCEKERPIQVVKGMFVGKMSYNDDISGRIEVNYLKKLQKKGVITLDSLSSSTHQLSNREQIFTLYNIVIKDEYKKYITKQKENIVYVKILYREVQEVLKINLLTEYQADVETRFKKIKTPFYDTSLDKTHLKDKPDEYTEAVRFGKGNEVGWVSCH